MNITSKDKEVLIVKLERDLNILGRGAISLITSSKLYVLGRPSPSVSIFPLLGSDPLKIDFNDDEFEFFTSIISSINRCLQNSFGHSKKSAITSQVCLGIYLIV